MTFLQFLETKYPVYAGKDLSDFHPPLSQVLKDHEEWLKHQNNRTLEEKKRDAVNSMPLINLK